MLIFFDICFLTVWLCSTSICSHNFISFHLCLLVVCLIWAPFAHSLTLFDLCLGAFDLVWAPFAHSLTLFGLCLGAVDLVWPMFGNSGPCLTYVWEQLTLFDLCLGTVWPWMTSVTGCGLAALLVHHVPLPEFSFFHLKAFPHQTFDHNRIDVKLISYFILKLQLHVKCICNVMFF